MEIAKMAIIKTVCRGCQGNCGIVVHVRRNAIVEIKGDPEHPINQGFLCPKGLAGKQLVNDENRLKFPMRKVDGRWKRISWDEALDVIVCKLREVKEIYGAEALAINMGQAPGFQEATYYWQRFCNVYGTPNFTNSGMHCYWSRALAQTVTCGQPTFPEELGISGFRDDYEEYTRCMIFWGVNTPISAPMGAKTIFKLKKSGVKLIVVDPRKTLLAEKADIWAQIRPGTDAALALGIAHKIIEKELHDKKFISKYTIGFQELAKRAREYSSKEVEHITYVPANIIEKISETYATNRPGFIIEGVAVEHQTNGFQASRAIACLIGLTGNLDVAGGNILVPSVPRSDISLREIPLIGEPIGAKIFPLMVGEVRRIYGAYAHGMVLPEAIKQSKIKALFVIGAALLNNAAETKVWLEALSELEFLVVVDLYKAGFDEIADMFLPAASYLERTGLVSYGLYRGEPYISLREKTVDRWECWPDWKICFELARRMGYAKYFPWKGIEEAINEELKPTGLTIEDLRGKTGVSFGSMKYRKYKNGLRTASGKFEFYSSLMEKYGYDPLPAYVEPAESPLSTPKLAEKYPLILTSGARILVYTHSQHRTIPMLREKCPDPLAEIHPEVARVLAIRDGEWIIVESPRGEIRVRARVTEKIHPNVVQVFHGWNPPSNANELTSMKCLDPISGFPALRSGLCKVRRIF